MFKSALLAIAAFVAVLPFVANAQTADAPLFEDVHVVQLPKGEYGYRGMPGTIVALNDGRLLLAYTRMLPTGSGDGSIAGKYSEDKGKTWGEEFVLAPDPQPAGQDYYCHPSLLRLQNGQIFLSYIYGSGAEMPNLFGGNYYRRSADDGKTWGDQLIVTAHPGYTIVHNDKFIQLSSGRILAPAEFHLDHTRGDHSGYVSLTVYSDDNGYSWHESTNMVNMQPIETQEPHVVELKDGRIMMLMRTYNGFVARSYSTDKGESWSEGEKVEALTLAPNSSALNIKHIPKTGDLVLLRCTSGTKGRRTPMTSILSKDEGATWTNERAIGNDPDDDYGYPGLTFVDDVALVVYHMRDGLHVARIGSDWFSGN